MRVGWKRALERAVAAAALLLLGLGAVLITATDAAPPTGKIPAPKSMSAAVGSNHSAFRNPHSALTPTPTPTATPTPTPTPLPTPSAQITHIVFSEGGSVFMTGDSGGTVQVRESKAGALRRSWSVGAAVRGIDAVAGSRRLLVDTSARLSQWDIPSGGLVGESDSDPKSGALLAAAGSRFYGRFTDRGIVLTNYVFGDTYSFDLAGGSCYDLSPGARSLAVGCAAPAGGITFFDLFNRRQLLTCQDAALGSGVATLAFQPDGKSVVSVQTDGSVLQSSVDTGASNDLHLGVARPGWVVTGAQFSSDAGTLAVAARKVTSGVSLGGGVRVFDLRSGRMVSKFPGLLTAFALSPDATRLVVAFRDGNTTLYDVATGQPVATWGIEPAPEPQQLLNGLELPDELQLLLDRGGPDGSDKSHYVLRRTGVQFQVTATFENIPPDKPRTSHVVPTISAEVVRKFVAALAETPCTLGRYTPMIDRHDDNIHYVIVFHNAVRSFSLYTDSQGVEGMPWGFSQDGKDYTINSQLPGLALDALQPALTDPVGHGGSTVK